MCGNLLLWFGLLSKVQVCVCFWFRHSQHSHIEKNEVRTKNTYELCAQSSLISIKIEFEFFCRFEKKRKKTSLIKHVFKFVYCFYLITILPGDQHTQTQRFFFRLFAEWFWLRLFAFSLALFSPMFHLTIRILDGEKSQCVPFFMIFCFLFTSSALKKKQIWKNRTINSSALNDDSFWTSTKCMQWMYIRQRIRDHSYQNFWITAITRHS